MVPIDVLISVPFLCKTDLLEKPGAVWIEPKCSSDEKITKMKNWWQAYPTMGSLMPRTACL
jgi:hypothetical protein